MAEHQQQSSSTNENVGMGVGNSVVLDLMRVYENLTQSSTPQAGVPDASKSLSIAYNNNSSNNVNTNNNSSGPPQTIATHLYQQQPPVGYPVPLSGYQQQQTTAIPNNPLHSTSQPPSQTFPAPYINIPEGVPAPNATSYPQQQLAANSGYDPSPMGTVPPGGPPQTTNTDSGNHHSTQESGEGSHHASHSSLVDGSASYSQATIVRSSSTISNQQAAADASSESDKSAAGGRPRRKRKHQQEGSNSSSGGKKGSRSKKSKKEDGRWSKRFTWPEDLHRDFVSAIFDVGLKHSSPSTIMEHMPKHENITTERIKSHLQKYRLHRVKSKKEFISSYEASLRNFQQTQSTNNSNSALVSGSGEVAAHLTSTSLGISKAGSPGTGPKEGGDNSSNAPVAVASSDQQQLQNPQNCDDVNDSLMLPQLTEAEKQSPIGAAMGYLMGLFFSLKQQLIIQRSLEAAGEKAKGNALFTPSSTNMVAGNSNIAPTAVAATAAAVAVGVEFAADGTIQQAQQPPTPATMRTNIEENSMMKREMKNQMALQNKMRALKQQELAKYKNINKGTTPDAMMTVAVPTINSDPHLSEPPGGMDNNSNSLQGDHAIGVAQHQQHQNVGCNTPAAATQGAGEMVGTEMPPATTTGHATTDNDGIAGNNNTNNLYAIGNADDFWHTDVVDDQLFEFLMND